MTNSDSRPAPLEPGLLRTMVAVLVGFFVFAAELALGMAVVTVAANPDWVFEPGRWQTSTSMELVILALGAVGGVSGGLAARLLGGSRRVTIMFAVALFVMMVVHVGIRSMATDANAPRTPEATKQSAALTDARPGPIWMFGMPVIVPLASLLGGAIVGKAQRALLGR